MAREVDRVSRQDLRDTHRSSRSARKSRKSERGEGRSDAASVNVESERRSRSSSERKRELEKLNNRVEHFNRNRENLDDARQIVEDQLSLAADLKSALKAGDQKKEDAVLERIFELELERDHLAERVTEDNASIARVEALDPSARALKLGKVNFAGSEPKVLTTEDGVESFIEELKAERQSLEIQTKGLEKAETQLIKELESRGLGDKSATGVVRSLEEAIQAVSKLADDIRSNADQSVRAQRGVDLAKRDFLGGLE